MNVLSMIMKYVLKNCPAYQRAIEKGGKYELLR